MLGHQMHIPFRKEGSTVKITIPSNVEDTDVTVVAIRLAEELSLEKTPTTAITYAALQDTSLKTQYAVEAITQSISEGNNPFDKSNLSSDGLNYSLTDSNLTRWVTKHAEALYKTTKGMPKGHFIGSSALSADKQTLYLFVKGIPTGPIAIKGLRNIITTCANSRRRHNVRTGNI
ncbi:hypothetical protein [Olivibacter sp. SDN3]|uniref:hypothetical protein n=1 Tax=Olivibacter sp. SDN3 TaxID=2764720 RepID=UPI0021020B4F|nr:hypothetical protein [Olivibacter sp. SDN3]